ncbi:MAG: hypothetical protein RIM99_14490 [Cyclobacteriaceae bacterium]
MVELQKHLRSIQFFIGVTAFGVLISQFFNSKSEAYIAYEQLLEIQRGLQKWDEKLAFRSADSLLKTGKFHPAAVSEHQKIQFEGLNSYSRTITFRPTLWQTHKGSLIPDDDLGAKPETLEQLDSLLKLLPDRIYALYPTGIPRKAKFDVRLFRPGRKPSAFIRYAYKFDLSFSTIQSSDTIQSTDAFSSENRIIGRAEPAAVEDSVDSEFIMKVRFREGLGIQDTYFAALPIEAAKVIFRPKELLSKKMETKWPYLSLDENFPELMRLTQDYSDERLSTVAKVLHSERQRTSEVFEIFGVKIPGEKVGTWGLFILLSLQFYFLVHYKQFKQRFNREKMETDEFFPWVGIYEFGAAKWLFVLSMVILPAAVHIMLIVKVIQKGGFDVSLVFTSLVVLGGIVASIMTFTSIKQGIINS